MKRLASSTTFCAVTRSTVLSWPTPTMAMSGRIGCSTRAPGSLPSGRPWGVEHPRHSWVDVDGARGHVGGRQPPCQPRAHPDRFPGAREGNGVGDDRHHGWQRAMDDLGLPTTGLVARAEDGIATGKALTQQMMDGPHPPTAFVCVSDAMAVGALGAIEDGGLVAGRDVSVVGLRRQPDRLGDPAPAVEPAPTRGERRSQTGRGPALGARWYTATAIARRIGAMARPSREHRGMVCGFGHPTKNARRAQSGRAGPS